MNEQGEQRGDSPQLSEEQVQALEEELRKVRVEDLLLQSVASLINLTARRIGKEDERDLEQGRIGIEAVRALVELLPDDATPQVREALSQLQILYAQASEGKPAAATGEDAPEPPPGDAARGAESDAPGPPTEPPPRLWTPPGST